VGDGGPVDDMTGSVGERIGELLGSLPAPVRPAKHANLRQAVAFFLLVDRPETRALLVKKKETPGYTWSGQVGMVGGMIEEDDAGDLEAGVREFEEELALPGESLRVLGDLGFFPSTIANALLHVYVALWTGDGSPEPDRKEIDYLIEVPLADLAAIHETRGYGGLDFPRGRNGPFYPIDVTPLPEGGAPRPVTVWGVTARAVHRLLEMLRP